MSSTPAPLRAPEEQPVESSHGDVNQRLELGEKEQKFVIKLCTPIPA